MPDASRVLLAHSYFLRYDAKQTRKMKPYPPLATLITASLLRRAGHEVALFDAMLSEGEQEFARLVLQERPAVVSILEDNFNFLTKMCTTRMREAALQMIRDARRAGCRVVVNGSDATDHPELYLSAGAHAVILGESEETLLQLLPRLVDQAPLTDVRGLALPGLRGDAVHRTPPRPFVENLDGLPLPAWDLVDVDRYRQVWKRAHGRFSWNAATTRGCPFHCNWCAKPLYGTRYAQRSPESVADELRALKERVAPDHVWFADDIFGLTPRWIERFAEAVAARDARIPFSMQSRVDLMTPSAVAALSHAGAEEVWMGVESGAQHILDAMEKGTRLAQVRSATRGLKAHGIRSSWFLQLGYPGEDWDDILATRDLVRQERPDDIGVSVSYPLPGTKFYESVKSQLGERTNWEDSDDLAMMFAGTFQGPFYKKVRDLLHEEAAMLNRANGNAERLLPAFDDRWDEIADEQHVHRSERPTRPVELPSEPQSAHP